MQRGKKILALILVVVLCLGIVPLDTASAKVYAAKEDVSSYGVQLTTQQKEIYDALVKKYIGTSGLSNGLTENLQFTPSNAISYGSESAVKEAVKRDVGYAVTAFLEDYPQIYWVGGYQYSFSYYSSTYKVASITVIFNDRFEVSAQQIQEFNTGVLDAVKKIQNSLPADASLFEKHQAIHDWICDKAYYSENGRINPSAYPETHTPHPIFVKNQDGGVVCEGYAKAYKIICDQMDLNCMLVSGTAYSKGSYEAHMWNVISMPNDKWYVVDATWDDQEDGVRYEYFLCGEESPCFDGLTFEQDHVKDKELAEDVVFEYPELSEHGYDGYLGNLSYNYRNGTLTISGNGNYPAYLRADRVPWYAKLDEIKTLVISDGITGFPEGCFADMDNLEILTIPYVGLSKDATNENAVLGAVFGKTDSSGTVQYYGIKDGYYQGYYYDIPSSLRKVVVTDDDNLEFGAFYNCSRLQSLILNSEMEEIASESMCNCASLTEIVIPNNVEFIGLAALQDCENLKSITLPFVGSSVDASGTYDAVLGYIFGYGDASSIPQYFSYGNGGGAYYDIPDTLKSVTITNDSTIPFGAFSNCATITDVKFVSKVTQIADLSFMSCDNISLSFWGNTAAPDVSREAFRDCTKININVTNNINQWESIKNNQSVTINLSQQNATDLVAKIDTAKISLGDKIAVKFMVSLDDSVSEDDYMQVMVNGQTTTIKVKDATVVQSDLNGKEKHVFICEVNAKEMTKPIQAQMIVDGVAGSPVSYSVKKYADVILGMATGTYEAEKTMIRAMLNYGGYAQKYFVREADWNKEVFANQGLYETAEDPVLKLTSVTLDTYAPSGTNVDKLTATLLLESETELRFYFTPENGKSLNDYSYEVTGTNKKLVTGTKNGQCYVAITGICANELQDMYTVTIREKRTNEVFASVKYGVLSYVRTVLNGGTADVKWQNLVKALYLYNQAALDYSK